MDSRSHPRKRVRRQVSAVTPDVSTSLLPNISGSSFPISGPPRELVFRGHQRGETSEWGRRGQVSIDILPDDVLLEIFEHAVPVNRFIVANRWYELVHVCRRWRSVVFASTHRLNLELRCSYKTPVRNELDTWPALPIIIHDSHGRVPQRAKGADNIVAALGHPDRVRRIQLQHNTPNSVLEQIAAEMKKPFPELTYIWLSADSEMVSVLPDSFLGGSAPRLQELHLRGIPFPAIPKLLSSASDLVELFLRHIPHSGYISPEAMVTGLSALTRLERLSIEFQSPRSRPGQSSAPWSTHTVLPVLKDFYFHGVSEYLEDLTSRIDAPLLSNFRITFFNQLIFNTPRLCAFISRTETLRSSSHLSSQAKILFDPNHINLSLSSISSLWWLDFTILCKPSDWQLSSLAQFCDSSFLSLFNIERLYFRKSLHSRLYWQDVEHTQWLELLHPFITVKRLSLSREFIPYFVPVLQELSEERIDMLSALKSIFLPKTSLSGCVKKALAQFLTARQLSGHPVAVNPQRQE